MAFSDKGNIELVKTPEPPRGELKFFDLYSLALGAVIGTGVISLIGYAIAYTAYSAWLAYFAAIIFGFLYTLPFVFVCATFRLSSNQYSIIGGFLSEFWGGAYGVAGISTLLCVGIFGSAFAEYMNTLIPGVPLAVWSVGLICIFYVVNMSGIGAVKKVQNVMFFLLVASLLAFIAFGLPNVKNPIFQFSSPQFMPNGFWKGFFPAMILLSTSCTGYNAMMPAYGGFARNATKDLPRAMLLVLPSIILLYVGCGIVACGVLPLEQIAGQPLTATAKAIFPGIGYLVFIICGPIMCITTTLNATMPALCQVVGGAAESGWFPESFARKNGKGMYVIPLTLTALMGIIPNMLGFNTSQIMMMSTLCGSLCNIPLQVAFFLMPIRYPEAWKNSRFHVPLWLYYIICAISAACCAFLFYNSCTQLSGNVVFVNIALVVVCLLYTIYRSRSGKVRCVVSMWPRSHINDETFPEQETAVGK